MRLQSLDDARFDPNISFMEQEFQSNAGDPEHRSRRAAARARARVRRPARARRARGRRRPAEEHGLAPARRARAQRPGRAGGDARRVPRRARDGALRRPRHLARATSPSWPSARWRRWRRPRGRRSTSRWRGRAGVEHLAQIDSRHYLGTSHWVGRRVPYHCSANGKVLLAFSAAGADRRRARGAHVAHDRRARAARRRARSASAARASRPRSTSSSWASAPSPRRCSTTRGGRSPR